MAKTKKEKRTRVSGVHQSIFNADPSDSGKSHWVFALFTVLTFGLIVRMLALLDLETTIYRDFLLWDERVYHEWAKQIAEGSFQSKSVYEFAPVPAYLMAVIYRLFSPDVFLVRLMNILFGILACGLVYGIARELAGKKTALLACAMACFYGPFLFYSIVPLKESLGLLLFTLTTYLMVKRISPGGLSDKSEGPVSAQDMILMFWLGISAGLLLNVRPNAVALVPVILVILLWYFYQDGFLPKRLLLSAMVYGLGLAAAVSPFVIRNYVVANQAALTTTQTGFNLYLGNALQNPDPYSRPAPFAISSPFEQGIQFTIEASRRVGRKLTPGEASEYWTAEIFRQAVADPLAFARKTGQKILAVVNRFEACDHYDIEFMSHYAKIFQMPFLCFSVIFPPAMLGMLTAWKNKKARALGVILLCYSATLVIFFTNGRYRLPMAAILIPFAALGFATLYREARNKLLLPFARHAAFCAFFVAVTFFPVQASDDVTAYYNTHAIILLSKGYEKEAMTFWKKSSEMNRPFSDFANLSLAGLYYRSGKLAYGNAYLNKISDDSFAAAYKYKMLGEVFARGKNPYAAIAAFEKSLSINSGQRQTRLQLINLYQISDPEKAGQEKERLKYIESFYDLM